MDVVEESFLGVGALRVRAVKARGMTELIPTVRMESQHSVGSPTCHDIPRNRGLKKNKISVRSPALVSARIAPKI